MDDSFDFVFLLDNAPPLGSIEDVDVLASSHYHEISGLVQTASGVQPQTCPTIAYLLPGRYETFT